MGDNICKKHREYQAKRKPTASCDTCVNAWNTRHTKDRVKIIATNDFDSPNYWTEVVDDRD